MLKSLSKEDKSLVYLIGGIALAIGVTVFLFRDKIFGGLSNFSTKLTKLAIDQYNEWGKGTIKEGSSSTMDELRKYWAAVGWKDRSDHDKINEAWSAAFISWLMMKAGAGEYFKYSPSHSTYIVQSIKNRKANTGKFRGYKPSEVKVEIGDLIGRPRQSGISYDTTGSYKSHTDVVVDIKDGKAKMIGGNVADSVSATFVDLDASGKIAPTEISKKGYHVVIKNLM